MARLMYLLCDITQSSCQHTVGTSLSSKRLPNDHEAVPDNHHLVDLENLLLEHLGTLEVHLLAVLFDCRC